MRSSSCLRWPSGSMCRSWAHCSAGCVSCDAVLTPKTSQDEENRVWQVLDAILRTTQPEMIAQAGTSSDACGKLEQGKRLRWYPPFTVDPGPPRDDVQRTTALDSTEISAAAATVLQPLQTTYGSERRPPNKHPAVIWFSPPNNLPRSCHPPSARASQRGTTSPGCLGHSSSMTLWRLPNARVSSRRQMRWV